MRQFILTEDIKKSIHQWIFSGDTGISSETIVCVALGVDKNIPFGFDVPHDSSDFGRCYRLLKMIPELINVLPLVVEKCPKWKPLVEDWNNLTALYEKDEAEEPVYEMLSNSRGRKKTKNLVNKRALWDRLQELYPAVMNAGGYTQISKCSWQKL